MIDRRTFLRRTAVLAVAVAALPSLLSAEPVRLMPRDDTALVQQMLDDGMAIYGMTFHISQPIRVGVGATIRDCTFIATRPLPYVVVFSAFDRGGFIEFTDNRCVNAPSFIKLS